MFALISSDGKSEPPFPWPTWEDDYALYTAAMDAVWPTPWPDIKDQVDTLEIIALGFLT